MKCNDYRPMRSVKPSRGMRALSGSTVPRQFLYATLVDADGTPHTSIGVLDQPVFVS
jgi:hypothetical protein